MSFDYSGRMVGTKCVRVAATDSSSTPVKRGLVTVSGHAGDELAIGTLSNVRRQAGLKRWNI